MEVCAFFFLPCVSASVHLSEDVCLWICVIRKQKLSLAFLVFVSLMVLLFMILPVIDLTQGMEVNTNCLYIYTTTKLETRQPLPIKHKQTTEVRMCDGKWRLLKSYSPKLTYEKTKLKFQA